MGQTLAEATQTLQRQLIAAAPERDRCHNLRLDGKGLPYCASGAFGKYVSPSPSRRNFCDTASLQLWCLDPSRHSRCISYD